MHYQLNTIEQRMNWQGKRIHMVGIGGCGMMGAASILAELGARVSGTDRQGFEGVGELVRRGVKVVIGHGAEFVPEGVDVVVRTAAAPADHVEVRAAESRGAVCLKYAELVGQFMCGRVGVSIAGTHGKTTTTAMTAHIFRTAGLSPTFVVGAKSSQLGGSSALGEGPHFIVESCEFDRSFLQFYPYYATILNIEKDHFDCFPKLEDLVEAFGQFARQVHPQGRLLVRAEDALAREAAGETTARLETFGLTDDADWRAEGLVGCRGAFAFTVVYRGRRVLTTHLKVLGEHNVTNALSAAAVSIHAGVSPEAVAEALATFEGAQRRMTFKGVPRGVTIVDDYAHHPTEIRVTIDAVKRSCDPRRTWVIFQPHQFCRTKYLLEDFARSFDAADEVIVPDVYDARSEGGIERDVSSGTLVARMRERGVRVRHVPQLKEVTEVVAPELAAGDLVLTLGAGDVWKVADELVARMA
ncbi:MAG: UDP-N-acetylmuramate--L-alanine ligase [Planctomycetota bacterium]|nr:MAG: UDP-N-acetylmuramate--L-alanine ligase [Planctomycetota bacterium]